MNWYSEAVLQNALSYASHGRYTYIILHNVRKLCLRAIDKWHLLWQFSGIHEYMSNVTKLYCIVK